MRRLAKALTLFLVCVTLPALASPPYRGGYGRRPAYGYRGHVYRGPVRGPVYRGPGYHPGYRVVRRAPAYGWGHWGPVYTTPPIVGPTVIIAPPPEPVYVVQPRVRIVRPAPAYEEAPEEVYDEGPDELEAQDDACPNMRRDDTPPPAPRNPEWDAAQPPPAREPPPAQGQEGGDSVSLDDVEAEILRLTNAERQRAGLAPLRFEARLADAARLHSEEMAAEGYFSHDSPTPGYATLSDRIAKAGIADFERASENIAMGTFEPAEAAARLVEMWMNSPGHRKNILDPDVRFLGVGTATNAKGELYATQDFSKLAQPAAPSREEGPVDL